MKNESLHYRINILDGFRAIAILMVLFFHYFSRWIPLYPYGSKYDFFSYGKMGVQLFFIISGFVILYTLENTNHFILFWKKRIIRLFPSMLIASFITYSVLSLLDTSFLFPNSHYLKNILASVTFLPPDSLASIMGSKVKLDYISGSYWSLWPEIQFYLFVSFVYFFNKKRFVVVFLSLSFVFIIANYLLHLTSNQHCSIVFLKLILKVFNFLDSLHYFCFGVLFYLIYKNKILNRETSILLKFYFLGLFIILIFYNYNQPFEIILNLVFLLLFMLLIYKPRFISFFENKFFLKIGVSSYFLYLIHENIGVLLIYKYGISLPFFDFIFSLSILAVMISVSILYTYNLEKKINYYLNKIILKK